MASRRTKIIATVGPATLTEPLLSSLIEAGVDGIRLNFSYGDADQHSRTAETVRRLSLAAGRPIALVQDLQGPKIRIGRLSGGLLAVTPGTEVVLTGETDNGGSAKIPVGYPALAQAVRQGDRILLGDGEVELRVESLAEASVRARVIEGGLVKDGQGVHFSRPTPMLEALTEKDVADVRLGVKLGVDYVALSFCRRAQDIERLKSLLATEGVRTPVIAKVEKQEAVQNLIGILRAADGIMVARGDLGLELPLEDVPLLQKQMIRAANNRGVVAITATQMLESMVESPRPTRAEVSDVANAILDGTDAVMLSAETAIGRHPVQAVAMMARIAEKTDKAATTTAHSIHRPPSRVHAMSRAACELATEVRASAIIVFTRTGRSARLVSRERPPVPIFAFTDSERVWRELALRWGVDPLLSEWPRNVGEMVATADQLLLQRRLLNRGDTVVVARWSTANTRGWTNFVHLHRLGVSEAPML
jgi:pyruvate kinase